ncbi:MAG: RNA 2',3'-cyclic phosphodiesterase [bacterium JZ-2024 1]
MRVFSGFDLTERLRTAILRSWTDCRKRIKDEVRAVSPENWHLTLYFYGEISESELSRLYEAYAPVCERLSAFRVTLGRWGGFPSARKARVIWAGLSEGNEKVREVKRALDEAHREARIAYEEKEYHPHITVARSRREPVRIEETVLPSESDELNTIGIYRSILTPRGAIYEALQKYRLRRGGN